MDEMTREKNQVINILVSSYMGLVFLNAIDIIRLYHIFSKKINRRTYEHIKNAIDTIRLNITIQFIINNA